MVGVSFGWVNRVSGTSSLAQWLWSAMGLDGVDRSLLGGAPSTGAGSGHLGMFRMAGILGIVILVIVTWRLTARTPWMWLSLSLLAIVLLAPSMHPWYFLWPLVIAAVMAWRTTQIAWIAAASCALVVSDTPAGNEILDQWFAAPVVAGAGLVAVGVLRQATRTVAG